MYFLEKVQEWFYNFLLMFAIVFGWFSTAAYVIGPIILGTCVNPWYWCLWVITIPAAITNMVFLLPKRG